MRWACQMFVSGSWKSSLCVQSPYWEAPPSARTRRALPMHRHGSTVFIASGNVRWGLLVPSQAITDEALRNLPSAGSAKPSRLSPTFAIPHRLPSNANNAAPLPRRRRNRSPHAAKSRRDLEARPWAHPHPAVNNHRTQGWRTGGRRAKTRALDRIELAPGTSPNLALLCAC
jgi:hypothetical protein